MGTSSRTECECEDGWTGFMCSKKCPTSPDGATCGGEGKGECQVEKGRFSAKCVCFPGHSGPTCSNSTGTAKIVNTANRSAAAGHVVGERNHGMKEIISPVALGETDGEDITTNDLIFD